MVISDKRILKVIEGLTMGEFTHPNQNESLDQIYRFAHLAGTCKNPHKSWVDEFLKCEKLMVDNGIIPDYQTSVPVQTQKDQTQRAPE